jgi:hypothetical protein
MRKESAGRYLFIVFLFILGMYFPVFVLWKNIFPSFRYESTSADSNGISIFRSETKTNEEYLMVPVLGEYIFDRVDLDIFFNNKPTQQYKIDIAKDYIANTYPWGKPIDKAEELRGLLFSGNPPEIPNGELFSFDGSAYVVSRGKYYPILSPDVFLQMGYYWENIKSEESSIFSHLDEGDKINYMSLHPDGTIFKTIDGEYFLIWEGEKRKIANANLIMDVWPSFFWIDVSGSEPDYFDSCEIGAENKKISSCEIKLAKKEGVLGKTYIFKTSPSFGSKINNARAVFKTKPTFDKSYLRYAFGLIKNRLYQKYAKIF